MDCFWGTFLYIQNHGMFAEPLFVVWILYCLQNTCFYKIIGCLQNLIAYRYGMSIDLTLEKAMAPHSSTLAWKIPWMEEPGRLQSMGSLRVGHDWATSLSFIGEGNSNPLQCSCLESPRDRGAWWAAVYGVAQSQTRLKRLSSSSSSSIDLPHLYKLKEC